MTSIRQKRDLVDFLAGLLVREDRMALIAPMGLDWVTRFLQWHKVLPLARELFLTKSTARNRWPDLTAFFEQDRLRHAMRDETGHRQLRAIATAFDAAQIPFLVIKGPVWAQPHYPSALWRHIGDIDLLVAPENKRRGVDTLLNLEYTPVSVGDTLEADLACRGEAMFMPPTTGAVPGLPVELHWHLTPAPRFMRQLRVDGADLIADAHRIPYRDLTLHRPTPELQMAYQIVHGICQHQAKRFLPVVDWAHATAAEPPIDWDRVADIMHGWKAVVPLYMALSVLDRFGICPALPKGMKGRIRRAMPGMLRLLTRSALGARQVALGGDGRLDRLRRELVRVASARPLQM